MASIANIIKELSSSPDNAWRLMKQGSVTLLELLDEPAHKLNEHGLRRIAEFTAQDVYPSQTANRQQYYQELCLLIDDKFKTSPKSGAKTSTAQPQKTKADLLQDLYNQAQGNKQRQSSASNPFPNTKPSVLLSGGVNAVKNLSRHLQAPTGRVAKVSSRFLIVHPDYLKGQFFDDLAHHIGHMITLMFATFFIGLILSAFASYYLIAKGWYGVFQYAKYVFIYLGMVSAWNFYLYKHRGYRWK